MGLKKQGVYSLLKLMREIGCKPNNHKRQRKTRTKGKVAKSRKATITLVGCKKEFDKTS